MSIYEFTLVLFFSSNSEFVDIGKGGLSQNPEYILAEDAIEVELIAPVITSELEVESDKMVESLKPNHPQKPPARGWIFHENGTVELVAHNPNSSKEQRTWNNRQSCQ